MIAILALTRSWAPQLKYINNSATDSLSRYRKLWLFPFDAKCDCQFITRGNGLGRPAVLILSVSIRSLSNLKSSFPYERNGGVPSNQLPESYELSTRTITQFWNSKPRTSPACIFLICEVCVICGFVTALLF